MNLAQRTERREQDGKNAERGAKSRALRARWWFNAFLTIAALTALLLEALPLPVIFMIAFAIRVRGDHDHDGRRVLTGAFRF